MLGSLPSLPNGKIDRRALPAPDSVQPRAQRAYVAPSNPIEEKLAEIWARVLGRERVSVNDNFFELGGHSLLATVAVSHIREAFQIEVPLRYVFEAPTVSGLSAIVLRSLVEQTNEYEVAQMLDEIEQL
jgi:acyl carrier protein